MFRRSHTVALLLALLVTLSLSGCGIGRRVVDWVAKPEWKIHEEEQARKAQRLAARQPAPRKEEPAPPREDFSNYQPKPIPSGPDVRTDRDFEPIRLKWLKRISIDLYREMGMRDAGWDKQAEALLEAYAQIKGCQHEKPTIREFEALADAAMATECPDPLVRATAGEAYFLAKRYEDAYEHIFFPDPPDVPDYPDITLVPRHAVGWQLHCQLGAHQQYLMGSHQVFASSLASALREMEFEGEEVRAVYCWLEHMMDEMQEEQYAMVLERLQDCVEDPNVDPWLIHTIMGYLEWGAAWCARGSSFANEVTDKGWEGFKEHLPLAREHLARAWKLHPDWPEPAGMMAGVITGESGASPDGRAWFDRAVAAEMDHVPAYDALIWQLMPRWGGSHDEMWALAEECLATKRYDTATPWMAFAIAAMIAQRDGAPEFVADPAVYAQLTEMFRGYLAAPDPCQPEATIRSMWAAIASLGGHHRDVIAQLDAVGDDVQRETLLSELALTPSSMRRDAEMALSPQAAKLRSADEARADGDYRAARRHYEAVLAASPEDAVAGAARGGLRAIDVMQAFNAGETVQLVPGFTPDQCPVVAGEWEVASDGTLIHRPNGGQGGEFAFPMDIPDNYRLVAEIAFPPDDDRVRAMLMIDYARPGIGLQCGCEVVVVDRFLHKTMLAGTRLSSGTRQMDVHINRRVQFTAELYRQTLAGYLGTRRVISAVPLMEWLEEPDAQLMGISLEYRGPVHDPVRIESVTLEPLREAPPGWKDPSQHVAHLSRPWAGEMPEGR